MKVLIDNVEFVEKSINRNSGDWNSGHRNSGHRNSGHRNSGHWNSGDWNSGHWNSGDWNSGHRNSGDWNSGHRNSGHRNSGDRNSGHRNSGHRNSGHWNSGHRNSGQFNTKKPRLRLFNKKVKKSVDISKIYYPSWLYFNITEWVSSDKLTKNQKENNPHHDVVGGALIVYDYKDAAQRSYNKATKEEQRSIEDLPNFDADILYEIFGIDRRN